MPLTKILIDRAVQKCKSQAKLAERLEVSKQLITDWKNGKSTPTELHVALMAEIAGVRIEDALIARSADQLEKTPEGRRLLLAMQAGFLIGAGAILGTFATPADAEADQKKVDGIRIVSHQRPSLFFRTMFTSLSLWPLALVRSAVRTWSEGVALSHRCPRQVA